MAMLVITRWLWQPVLLTKVDDHLSAPNLVIIMRPEEETDGPPKQCGFCRCQRCVGLRETNTTPGWILHGWKRWSNHVFFSRSLMIFDDLCKLNAGLRSGFRLMLWESLDVGFVAFGSLLANQLFAVMEAAFLLGSILGSWTKSFARIWTVMQKDSTSNQIRLNIHGDWRWPLRINSKLELSEAATVPGRQFSNVPVRTATSMHARTGQSCWELFSASHHGATPGVRAEGRGWRPRQMGFLKCIFWSRNVKFGELKPTWHPGNFESTQILHSIRQSGKPVVFHPYLDT